MIRSFLGELRRRDPALFYAGCAHLALFAGMLAWAPFDERQVMGINPMIKPMKFAVSIAIYLWTVGWLLRDVERPRWLGPVVRWGVIVAMGLEMVAIALQGVRGTTSHYNSSSPFDAAVFNLMGLMILLNTFMVAGLLLMYLGRVGVPRPYLWGVRLGLFIFLLGSVEGLAMILRSSHTVGLRDGGPGLPIVNWSTRAGDLRIAHSVGLHAMQILPLVGWLMSRPRMRLGEGARAALVALAAVAYAAAGIALFIQAMAGRPLVRL